MFSFLFFCFVLFLSSENQRNHRWKKKPGTLTNACSSIIAFENTPTSPSIIAYENTPTSLTELQSRLLFSLLAFIIYQQDNRYPFYLCPSSHQVIRSNIIHSCVSSRTKSTVEWNTTGRGPFC